jgi:hypothetical protein
MGSHVIEAKTAVLTEQRKEAAAMTELTQAQLAKKLLVAFRYVGFRFAHFLDLCEPKAHVAESY